MRRIVVGIFDRPDQAQAAVDALSRDGFSADHIHVAQTRPHATAAVVAAPPPREDGVLGTLGGFLAGVFGPPHDQPAADRDPEDCGAVVRVDIDDSALAPRAELALVSAGATDITHRDTD